MQNDMNEFLVLHIPGTHMYDVFQGIGWENWSRVLAKEGYVKILKGNHIPIKTLYETVLYPNEGKSAEDGIICVGEQHGAVEN